jgi:hypothetical protein
MRQISEKVIEHVRRGVTGPTFTKLTLALANGNIIEFDLEVGGVEVAVDIEGGRAKFIIEGPWNLTPDDFASMPMRQVGPPAPPVID